MTAEAIEFKKGLETVAVQHLALRLAEAEHSLQALTSGVVDAIIDPSGKTYLLRPAQEHLPAPTPPSSSRSFGIW